jgi:hypothetical protein
MGLVPSRLVVSCHHLLARPRLPADCGFPNALDMRKLRLNVALALFLALIGAQHAAASARAYFVAEATDAYNFLLVNDEGNAYYIETEAAYQPWTGCGLMVSSLDSLVSVGTNADGQTQSITFPGSNQSCLLRKVRVLANTFRTGGSGVLNARYLAEMSGIDPIVLDATGNAEKLTLAPGCAPVLADLVGTFIFVGPSVTLGGRDQLYLFRAGRSCSIAASTSFPNPPPPPASYQRVLTEYESPTWPAKPDGRRVPSLLAPSASVPPSSTSPPPRAKAPAETNTKAETASYADVPASHFAAPYVAKLRMEGVVDASPMFRPDAPITRAEFAKLLVRAKHAKLLDPPFSMSFSDVPTSDALAQYVYTAAAEKWVYGSNGYFRPQATVSRFEAVVMLQRAYRLGTSSKASFADVQGEAATVAGAAQGAGLISGNGGKFEPNRPLTRAEAAKLLAKAMDL